MTSTLFEDNGDSTYANGLSASSVELVTRALKAGAAVAPLPSCQDFKDVPRLERLFD
ncbi:MAG TPA: hypothetical protein VH592_12680 [Gemmataceae bacterium]|jgi:hypothetical protein